MNTINRLQKSRDWSSTAVVVAYDDSDGWYDHPLGPIVNQSADPAVDALTGTSCGTTPAAALGGFQDRCGYGPRLPLLVISPYARANFVDHTVTDQSSVLRFIEDNWATGRIGNGSFDAVAGSPNAMFDFSSHHGDNHGVTLDPTTGLVTH